ncbi:unnamed protein product [Parajaminaea phylloscopi]
MLLPLVTLDDRSRVIKAKLGCHAPAESSPVAAPVATATARLPPLATISFWLSNVLRQTTRCSSSTPATS